MINSNKFFGFDYAQDFETEVHFLPCLDVFSHSHNPDKELFFPWHFHIDFIFAFWYVGIRFGKETTLKTDEEEEEYFDEEVFKN